MRQIMVLAACAAIAVSTTGCKNDTSSPGISSSVSFFEFQVAVRKEGREAEPAAHAGTFDVVSAHEIPVNVGAVSEEVTSVDRNGIWVDFRWDRSERRDGRLWLHGLQYRIRNEMLYEGSGGTAAWSSPVGMGINSKWDHLNSRISLTPGEQGNLLYHRLRWTDPLPAIPAIEMAGTAQAERNS